MSNEDLKREAARWRQRNRRTRQRAGNVELVKVEARGELRQRLAEYGFIERTDRYPIQRAVQLALDLLASGHLVPTQHILAFRRNDLRGSKLAGEKFDSNYGADTFRNPLGRRPLDSDPQPAGDLELNRADPELPTDAERPLKT